MPLSLTAHASKTLPTIAACVAFILFTPPIIVSAAEPAQAITVQQVSASRSKWRSPASGKVRVHNRSVNQPSGGARDTAALI